MKAHQKERILYLSHICTLEEAANYLSGETGDSWTPKSVLDFALTKPKQSSRKPAPIAFAAMPTETVFGRYEFTSPGGMVRKGGARWQLVPLYPIHAAQLVAAGNTFAGLLKSPDDDYSDGEHYEFIDPIESEHEITLDMVRLKRAAIESIAKQHNATASSGTPASDSPQKKEAISGVDRSDSAGMVAWQGDIIENKVEILNKYGNAVSARDLMSWCKAYGSEDVFKRDQPKCRDSLQWLDSYPGDVHTVTYKTVSSQLSIWRKEGIFPPRK